MENDKLLHLTRMRLLALQKPKSLKQLAVGIIARGIVEYIMEPEKELQFPIIPDSMKQTVLDEVACIAKKTRKPRDVNINGDSIKRIGLILDNLLSFYTVEFDSSWLLQIFPYGSESDYIQVLQTVSLRAPNLKFLLIGGDPISPSRKAYSCSPSMLSCIRTMHNLTHFVTKNISLEQLMELCSHLELLQFVNVKTLVINDPSEDNFDKLRRLKEFHFDMVISLHGFFKKELTSNCLKYLPNLEVIGKMVEKESSLDFYHPDVIEGPSKLRHLYAYPASIQEFQQFEHIFPETKHLAINWDRLNLPNSGVQNLQFPHFPRLQFVKMESVPDSEILEQFLQKNGENLKYLSIEQPHAGEAEFEFNTIFGLCPNLESLEIKQARINGSGMPISSNVKLKELTITTFIYLTWILKLSNILSIQTLEKIKISGVNFHRDDLINMIELVRTGQILQRVSSFDLSCWYMNCDCLSELSNLIKYLCAFAPKLTFIDVDRYHVLKTHSFSVATQLPLVSKVFQFLDAFP